MSTELAWYFFPITGVKLVDEELSINTPLVPNIAILSQVHLRWLLKDTELEHAEFLQKALIESRFFDGSEFYLAVRIPSDEHEKEQSRALAGQTADEFMALLMFFLFSETSVAACGLAARISGNSHNTLAINSAKRSWNLDLMLPQPLIFVAGNNGIVCKMADLIPKIKSSFVGPLLDIVLCKNNAHCHDSVLIHFKNAVRILAHAMYTNQSGELVAGTVTMFEVLLSVNNDRDLVVKKRVGFLTGLDVKEVEDRIYKPRNDWVHEAQPISKEIARKSLEIALNVLRSYAGFVQTAPKQTSWLDFLNWFDLQTSVQCSPRSEQLKKLWKHYEIKNMNLISK